MMAAGIRSNGITIHSARAVRRKSFCLRPADVPPGERFRRAVIGEVRNKKTLPACRQCEPFEERRFHDDLTTLVVDLMPRGTRNISIIKADGKYRLHSSEYSAMIFKEKMGLACDSIEGLLDPVFPGQWIRWWL